MAEANFTVTDISTEEMRNTYLLESTTEGGFIYKWDLGNGITKSSNDRVDTAFYEEKGTYTVSLTVASAGGQSVATQEVTVQQDASVGADFVVGGDMEDESAWAFYELGSTATSYAFIDGALTFSNEGTAQTNIGMWQAVELKAGTYQFSASVKGSGMTNSWMEVLLLNSEPAAGADVSGSAFVGLHTWTGCGTDAFEGKLPALSCIGDGKVSVTADGTYYLFIKIGSWDGNLGSEGLTVDDIKLIGEESIVLVEGDNLVQGSDMEDESVWTVSNVGLDLTTVEFTDGVLKFTNGTESTQTNVGVWQAVDVETDQVYKFDAVVKDPGSTGSWIEFYVHSTAPVDGVDYTEGKVAPGDQFTFETAGTVYVMIKVGSWDGNLGAEGVTVDDVRLVEMN